MNRKLMILFKTFSFLLIIPIQLLLEFFIDGYNSTGVIIGWIFGTVLAKIGAKPLYIDELTIDNSQLIIKYTNSILKKGIKTYDLNNVRSVRVKKETFFGNYGVMGFVYENKLIKFALLKMDQEAIINKVKALNMQ